jgi:hypothetical protein
LQGRIIKSLTLKTRECLLNVLLTPPRERVPGYRDSGAFLRIPGEFVPGRGILALVTV